MFEGTSVFFYFLCVLPRELAKDAPQKPLRTYRSLRLARNFETNRMWLARDQETVTNQKKIGLGIRIPMAVAIWYGFDAIQ